MNDDDPTAQTDLSPWRPSPFDRPLHSVTIPDPTDRTPVPRQRRQRRVLAPLGAFVVAAFVGGAVCAAYRREPAASPVSVEVTAPPLDTPITSSTTTTSTATYVLGPVPTAPRPTAPKRTAPKLTNPPSPVTPAPTRPPSPPTPAPPAVRVKPEPKTKPDPPKPDPPKATVPTTPPTEPATTVAQTGSSGTT